MRCRFSLLALPVLILAALLAVSTNAPANQCSQACLTAEFQCFDGCGGDQSCNQSCNDDYYCCLDACNPNGIQCP